MDAEILQGFLRQTEEYLPLVRGGILVCASTGGIYGEAAASLRQIRSIKTAASILGLNEIETACVEFERELKSSVGASPNKQALADEDARRLLDKLAALESLVAEIYFGAADFSESATDLIEESFGQFEPNRAVENEAEEFEIDDEMLEVFALEADDLVREFSRNLEILEASPENSEALFELRRVAHTLKGSAGVVGIKTLQHLAHRVEDLLDCLTGNAPPDCKKIFETLLAATDCFASLASGEQSEQLAKKTARVYESCDALAGSLSPRESQTSNSKFQIPDRTNAQQEEKENRQNAENAKSVVRVSLERLDEITRIADDLLAGGSTFERKFSEGNSPGYENLETLVAAQRRLIEDMRDKLARLRMVRFGSLAARLQRTVRVACEEEEKRADLFIEGEDLEIDTQILDGLVEPLLHLLRNAVAHGVEAPELRRLLEKPETGRIVLRAEKQSARIVVRVSDDGRGISADALREKAHARGFVSRAKAEALSDREAFELIFLNGLTTAENLSQTAGRGVGMNAVKTNIERRRGTISIESEMRKGTTFTVCLPALQSSPRAENPLSVLIVDDSPSIRRATSGVIKKAGWNSREAENGLEALDFLRAANRLPDVILTDAEMPQMDGYALLSALKSKDDFKEIPVVMITSRGEDVFRRRAVALGVSDFLTKPCDDALLLERIRKIKDKR